MYINNPASIRVFHNAMIVHNYCMFLEIKVIIKNSPDIYTVSVFKCNTRYSIYISLISYIPEEVLHSMKVP